MARSSMGATKRGMPQVAKTGTIPAFIGGINAQSSLTTMQPNEMLFSYNMVPSEYGLRSRAGSQEWTNGITGEPKTIIPFTGAPADGTSDRLFVADDNGIWDCTTVGTAQATKVFDFASPGADAGYGVWDTFTNDAAETFIIYADSINGLHFYTATTDTWAAYVNPTDITGVDPTLVRFVAVHKLRVWIILENDTDGYYFPLNSLFGEVLPFPFGSNLPHGGDLAALYTWTIDGGDGVDDFLVAVGRGGDIIPYQGSDPGLAVSWAVTGGWFIGGVPAGRRLGTRYGGELYLVSTAGILSVRDLFNGHDYASPEHSVAAKVTRLIRNRMVDDFNKIGWELFYHPSEGEMVLGSPPRPNTENEDIQYVLNLTVHGWGTWRDLAMTTFQPWRNRLMGVSADGRVWVYADGPDNVYLDPGTDGVSMPVRFSLLSSYQDLEAAGLQKTISFMRPTYIVERDFPSSIKAIPDYVIKEPEFEVDSPTATLGVGIWDSSDWDNAVWGGDAAPFISIDGGSQIGFVFAFALQGETNRRAALVSIGIAFQTGGFL